MNAQTHGELANFIWDICNLLRGPYKRNEYRRVILPLTVLRRFDCVLADTKDDVLAAGRVHAKQSENVRHQLLAAAAQRSFYNVPRRGPRLPQRSPRRSRCDGSGRVRRGPADAVDPVRDGRDRDRRPSPDPHRSSWVKQAIRGTIATLAETTGGALFGDRDELTVRLPALPRPGTPPQRLARGPARATPSTGAAPDAQRCPRSGPPPISTPQYERAPTRSASLPYWTPPLVVAVFQERSS